MRICILNSQTKVVLNVLEISQPIESFIPDIGTELAPQGDGEIGWTWTGTGWDVPTRPLDVIERERRDKYLHLYVDIINGVRWASYSQQQQNELLAYRQALLDVPQQSGFPTNINWPTPPQL